MRLSAALRLSASLTAIALTAGVLSGQTVAQGRAQINYTTAGQGSGCDGPYTALFNIQVLSGPFSGGSTWAKIVSGIQTSYQNGDPSPSASGDVTGTVQVSGSCQGAYTLDKTSGWYMQLDSQGWHFDFYWLLVSGPNIGDYTHFDSVTIDTQNVAGSVTTADLAADLHLSGGTICLSSSSTLACLSSLPIISSVSTTSVPVGSSGFALTVSGSNFSSGAGVNWTENGTTTPLSTQVVNSTTITAQVPASLLSNPGTAQVTVVSPSGQTSAPQTITITGSGPTITTKLTSDTSGIATGSCVTPPAVSSFTTASSQVWLYFYVTGASPGDTTQINWLRPDGVLYQPETTTDQYSSECFAYHINVSGAGAASYPGTWTVQVLWNGASLFSLNFTIAGTGNGGSGPVVVTKLTSSASGLVNNGCVTPPAVTSFNASAPQVWLYFLVTGANVGDSAIVNWVRPDGVIYTSDNPSVSYTSECFGYSMTLGGTLAASYPGVWTIQVFWKTATTPLFTLSFTVISGGQSPLQLMTVAPCRILNTMNPGGPLGGPSLAAGSPRTLPIQASSCSIPPNTVAYSLNVTVVPKHSLGSLTLWPTGIAQPNVSTLTAPGGSALASAAIVPAGTGGAIDAYATDDTDLIIDINGFFVPPTAATLQFYPLSPCRILDTRTPAAGGSFAANSSFGSPSLLQGVSRSFTIPSSSCGVPAGAAAYSLNLTLVPQGPLGYLTSFPAGQAVPFVSTMNSWNGAVLANAAIVPAGPNGAVSFFASDTTDLVVDINGYFAPPGNGGLNFYAVNPCRLVDTRNANGDLGGPAITAAASRSFPLSEGPCGIPAYPAVQAYSLEITAFPQSPLGYLSIWPAGGVQPVVSTLNAWQGQNVANAAIVPAGTGGAIYVFGTTLTNVTIDTAGYFGP